MLNFIDNNILNTLTQSELSILQYIDTHTSEVLNMSIHELSEKVFFSTATILRLCKKLNFSGYSELKFSLKNRLNSQEVIDINPINNENVLMDLYTQIENTSRLLDTKNIDVVVNYLLSDKKVHLFSTGITSMVFEYMQRYLLATERSTTLYKTDTIAYHSAQNLIIAITPLTNNPLSQLADTTLYFFSRDRIFSNSDVKSRTGIFYIIDIILQHYLYYLNQSKIDI